MKELFHQREKRARAAQQFAEELIGHHLYMRNALENTPKKESKKNYIHSFPLREFPALFPTLKKNPAQDLADSLEELLQQKR